MGRSVTEELMEVLKKKKADFLSLSQLNKALPVALRKQLGLASGSKWPQIEKTLLPHLGEAFMLKRGSKAYLALKQSSEVLLFRIVQKNNWKIPRSDIIPFKRDEVSAILNQLLEKDVLRVKKINKDYKILFFAPADGAFSLQARKSAHVSEEKFKEAYFELERGKFYVRICDLRRHLGWPAQEFGNALTGLRDEGKIQLQGGDTDYFTDEDIRESFIDENGFRKLTMMWRQ